MNNVEKDIFYSLLREKLSPNNFQGDRGLIICSNIVLDELTKFQIRRRSSITLEAIKPMLEEINNQVSDSYKIHFEEISSIVFDCFNKAREKSLH